MAWVCCMRHPDSSAEGTLRSSSSQVLRRDGEGFLLAQLTYKAMLVHLPEQKQKTTLECHLMMNSKRLKGMKSLSDCATGDIARNQG